MQRINFSKGIDEATSSSCFSVPCFPQKRTDKPNTANIWRLLSSSFMMQGSSCKTKQSDMNKLELACLHQPARRRGGTCCFLSLTEADYSRYNHFCCTWSLVLDRFKNDSVWIHKIIPEVCKVVTQLIYICYIKTQPQSGRQGQLVASGGRGSCYFLCR